MTFSEGTKEQLDQQWADLEADKQEALARIRAKQHNNGKESEMTNEKHLLTYGDLKETLKELWLSDDTQIAVTVPVKDIDGYIVNVSEVNYDYTSEALVFEPMYEDTPTACDHTLAGPGFLNYTSSDIQEIVNKETKRLNDRVNLLEEALMEIAAIEHQGDECPEWYQDHTVEDMHEDDPDYVKMLAWDETEWYWAWREDNQDQEQLEAAVDIARNVLKKSVDLEDSTMFQWKTDSDFCESTDSNDLPLYTDFHFKNMHDDYVGSVAWFGGYWFYFTTNNSSIIEDTYMTFSEWDDAVAWVNYQGKCATHFELGERADVHHVRSMPEIPLAKNTGEPLGGKDNTDLATNLNLPN